LPSGRCLMFAGGDLPRQPGVRRSIDFAHAADPKGGEDLVRADAGAGTESQAVGLYGWVGCRTVSLSGGAEAARPVLDIPFQRNGEQLATDQWREVETDRQPAL
jgi:hypothetical protein